MMIRALLLAFFLVIPSAALAGQTQIPDYDTARDNFFRPELYPVGGQGVPGCNAGLEVVW